MTPRVQETAEKVGACGCGRSPTGKCIGWHGLTEEEYQSELEIYQYRQQAQELWNDSCTSARSADGQTKS